MQEKLLFFPSSQAWNDCAPMTLKQAVEINTKHNGRYIKAWHIKAPNATARVYIFHGNGDRACNEFWSELITDKKLEFVSIEYPGYDGTPMSYEALIRRGSDVYDYLQATAPLPSIAAGYSLGTGLAVKLAAEKQLKGLILLAPYSSITDVAKDRYPWLPITILIRYPMPSADWAKSINSSVLIFHGKNDRVIPLKFGKKLSESVSQVEFIELENTGHSFSNIIFSYQDKINEYVDNSLEREEP